MQRPHAHQVATLADQGRAAPQGVRRAGEDRLVQHIFPIAGELFPGHDLRRHRAGGAAGAGDDHLVADRRVTGIADRHRRHVQRLQRLQQAEARRLVHAQNVPRDLAAFPGRQHDVVRLGDQIADGQDDPVFADHRPMADPFGAERRRREGVPWDRRGQGDHRGQHPVKVEGEVLRLRLGLRGYFPIVKPFSHSGAPRRKGVSSRSYPLNRPRKRRSHGRPPQNAVAHLLTTGL